MSYGTRISGIGDYRPSTIISNDELAKTVDTSDEWIRSRVGIANRRRASADDTVVSMAVAASAMPDISTTRIPEPYASMGAWRN